MQELTEFTWHYFCDHPEFLSLLNTENLHRAKYLKRSARIFDLHSPVDRRDLRPAAARRRKRPIPLRCRSGKVYISIAALGFFYLSNRWTLSTIFRRDLASPPELKAWGDHVADTVIASLRP